MSLYPEHKRQEPEVRFLTSHRKRKERENQESGEAQQPNEAEQESGKKERLKTATPQEAKNYLSDLVEKVKRFQSLGEVLVTDLFKKGERGPLNKQDKTVVSAIETSRGQLPVSDEVWEKGMELLAADLGWDFESAGFETRVQEGEEGGVRKETKLATIETELNIWKGVHLWRIVEFDQDSRPTLLSYEIFWQLF